MSLFREIEKYQSINQQEEQDKEQMLQFIQHNADYLGRN